MGIFLAIPEPAILAEIVRLAGPAGRSAMVLSKATREFVGRYEELCLTTTDTGEALVCQLFGRLHRRDGPAIIWRTGMVCCAGIFYCESHEGTWSWDAARREDGQVIVTGTGRAKRPRQSWMAKKYADNDPRGICCAGQQEWFFRGERHNASGPAILREDGTALWCLHGIYYGGQADLVQAAAVDKTHRGA